MTALASAPDYPTLVLSVVDYLRRHHPDFMHTKLGTSDGTPPRVFEASFVHDARGDPSFQEVELHGVNVARTLGTALLDYARTGCRYMRVKGSGTPLARVLSTRAPVDTVHALFIDAFAAALGTAVEVTLTIWAHEPHCVPPMPTEATLDLYFRRRSDLIRLFLPAREDVWIPRGMLGVMQLTVKCVSRRGLTVCH